MKVRYFPDVDLPAESRPVATLGNFDGVHLGHQRAMSLLGERAAVRKAPAVAITFEPHPVSVVRPEQAPRRILTPSQKEEVLASLGMLDLLVIIHFTKEFSRISAQAFVKRVLVDKLRVSELVLGANFRFGRGRSGDMDSLRKLGAEYGFVVHQVDAAMYEGEMVSSSRIRACVQAGDVESAADMMGRAYFCEGLVGRGDGRGRLMGFPTANIRVESDVLVENGVYVTTARLAEASFPGMTHVGRRPTFGLDERTVETHLFDFDREIYDQPVRLNFHHRIRGTVRFESADALQEQLKQDEEQARAFFRGPGRNLVL